MRARKNLQKDKFKVIAIFAGVGVGTLLTCMQLGYRTLAAEAGQEISWQPTKMTNKVLSSIEVTTSGLVVGENDSKLINNPYNGVYLSKDLGETWSQIGLENRGITDLEYDGTNLFATTFYHVNNQNGLFKYNRSQENWEGLFGNVSTTSVTVSGKSILLGTYSHGLWLSEDYGNTWVQKIGTGYFGPKIIGCRFFDEIALVALVNDTYISYDKGKSWNKVAALTNKNTHYFEKSKNGILYAGANNANSLFNSQDNGNTWNPVTSLETKGVTFLTYKNGILFVGTRDLQTNNGNILSTKNEGTNWEDVGIIQNESIVKDFSIISSYPDIVFALSTDTTVYKKDLQSNFRMNPFLSTPWHTENKVDLINNISAYFDHEYPLNGYAFFEEPKERRDTSTNFMGIRDKVPYQYYSGHNGTDFALPYGTQILAAASGSASYYSCKDCGHSIKIDHSNGYQTTYMHLQENELISEAGESPTEVTQGQVIGRVGMSGNTTGPHLHFTVTKGLFPNGLVDPFSWLSSFFKDPWADFSWTDGRGNHFGSASDYLWQSFVPFATTFNSGEQTSTQNNNKTLKIQEKSIDSNFTVFISHYISPSRTFSKNGKTFKYVSNSSLVVNLLNNLGTEIPLITKPAVIELDLSLSDMRGIKKDTIKLYHWNEQTEEWEQLESVFDLVNFKLSGETYSFSKFAAFGELGTEVTPDYPKTKVTVHGVSKENWYESYPIIELTTAPQGRDASTFYSLENEIWHKYDGPIAINKEGIQLLKYRSMFLDNQNSAEPTNEMLIRVDTQGKWKKTLKISGGSFSIP